MSVSIPCHHISFSKTTLSSSSPLFLSKLTLHSPPSSIPRKPTVIRMGGGPRTFPGGVSKWQWKRMQAKKAKQLLKARLSRERQIYEMRKRAELKAAVSELERPWEVVQKAPKLFSVAADEQVKVLADRFQKPGGFDLWSGRDGPQLFETPDGIPSARFFPKGVVHSIKPYGKISGLEESNDDNDEDMSDLETEIGIERIDGSRRKSRPLNGKFGRGGFDGKSKRDDFDAESGCAENSAGEANTDARRSRSRSDGKLRKNGGGGGRRFENGLGESNSGQFGSDRKQIVGTTLGRAGDSKLSPRKSNSRMKEALRKSRNFEPEVYDMNLQEDGTYVY